MDNLCRCRFIYAIIWADGTSVSVNGNSGIPNNFVATPSFSHTFAAAGTYYVQFFAKNSAGIVSATGMNVTVQ